MKVKPNQILKFYDGSPVKDQDGKEVRIQDVVVNALNIVDPQEENPEKNKALAFQISMKMYQKEADLGLEERAFIIERAGKYLNALAYGRLKELLEE
jgi:hypothetical protein